MFADNLALNHPNTACYSAEEMAQILENPIFIVSAPRAGSTLLFELMSSAFTFHTIGDESHSIYGQFPSLAKENAQFDSGCLTEEHANPTLCNELRHAFIKNLIDHHRIPVNKSQLLAAKKTVTFLEKTPRNSLNIPFLLKVFPRARFIYLHRQATENVSSLIDAWHFAQQTGHFVTFTELPDWPLKYWCFLLPPGWRKYRGKSITEIASFQWQASNSIILSELNKLPKKRWTAINYQDLIKQPQQELQRLANFCQVHATELLPHISADNLPYSSTTLTKPDENKWRKHEALLAPFMDHYCQEEENIHRFVTQ